MIKFKKIKISDFNKKKGFIKKLSGALEHLYSDLGPL